MNIPDYSQYAFEDFILDADFRAWVLSPEKENNDFWQELNEMHPEKQDIIKNAIYTIQHLSFNHDELSVERKESIWKVLDASFDVSEKQNNVIPINKNKTKFYWVAASISALLLMLGSYLFYINQPHLQSIHTSFGEIKRIILPDGSEVMLNGNSSLSYKDKWSSEKVREVWIEGEAFFKVSKIVSSKKERIKFITHTTQLDIFVLGTQYNVNTRRGKTKVMLVEGKIQLKSLTNKNAEPLEMKPGDFATSQVSIEKADIYRSKPELYDAWTRRQFTFKNAPLNEVAAMLEDTYGLKLIFEDSEMADYRLTANIQNENVETLITVIEATFNLKTEHINNQYFFNRK